MIFGLRVCRKWKHPDNGFGYAALQLLHAYARRRRRRIHGYNNNNNNIEVNVDDIVFYIPAQQQQKGLARRLLCVDDDDDELRAALQNNVRLLRSTFTIASSFPTARGGQLGVGGVRVSNAHRDSCRSCVCGSYKFFFLGLSKNTYPFIAAAPIRKTSVQTGKIYKREKCACCADGIKIKFFSLLWFCGARCCKSVTDGGGGERIHKALNLFASAYTRKCTNWG